MESVNNRSRVGYYAGMAAASGAVLAAGSSVAIQKNMIKNPSKWMGYLGNANNSKPASELSPLARRMCNHVQKIAKTGKISKKGVALVTALNAVFAAAVWGAYRGIYESFNK